MHLTKTAHTVSLLIVGLGLTVNGYSQSWITNGLVGYFPFTGDAHDASGHTNNGTVYGATLTADRFGQPNAAYSFNGSSWIDVGSVVSRYDLLTLSAWVYSTDSSAGPYSHGIVSKPRLAGGGAGLRLGLYGGELETGFNNSVVNLVVSDAVPATDGRWHHAVAVANVTNVSLYVDGQFSGSASFASNAVTSAASMFIGKEMGSGELRFFTGLIDDVRIYNRALSSSEVQQLFAIEAAPILNVSKAVYLDSSKLSVGTNYQLQVSSDMNTWTNYGAPFTATDSIWRTTNYWDVANWNSLYFRLQIAP